KPRWPGARSMTSRSSRLAAASTASEWRASTADWRSSAMARTTTVNALATRRASRPPATTVRRVSPALRMSGVVTGGFICKAGLTLAPRSACTFANRWCPYTGPRVRTPPPRSSSQHHAARARTAHNAAVDEQRARVLLRAERFRLQELLKALAGEETVSQRAARIRQQLAAVEGAQERLEAATVRGHVPRVPAISRGPLEAAPDARHNRRGAGH